MVAVTAGGTGGAEGLAQESDEEDDVEDAAESVGRVSAIAPFECAADLVGWYRR